MTSASGTAKLRVAGLAFGYGGNIVQHDVSFEVGANSIFAVMGGSGCGKSTLMKTMIGLLKPTAGSIYVGDEDYWGASGQRRTEIGRRFGVVFQSGALWSSMTVEENVALSPRMFTSLDDASIKALAQLKLSLAGLDIDPSTMPAELSGGMRKRVAVARTLALGPEIILFDEPTVGLDPLLSTNVDELILGLKEKVGCTNVVVTHDMITAFRVADQIGMFHEGVITALGTPEEFGHSKEPVVQEFIARNRQWKI